MTSQAETPANTPTAAAAEASADGSGAPPKTERELRKEAEQRAKKEKFLAKEAARAAAAAAKLAAGGGGGDAEEKKMKKKNALSGSAEFINTTPPGEKKDMTSQEMSAQYNPAAVESAWYSWWEKEGMFKPQLQGEDGSVNPEGMYSIVLPPPNVTGSLHLGHALMDSIEDCIVRYQRMMGKSTLFVPGIDHAGIATQIVVEKKLMRERNLTRHDLGRDAFNAEVWKWKEQYGNRIFDQLKRMGSSNDWDRQLFTMDPSCSKAVNETFVRLHEEGVIYRANRLVNWCSKLRTALSNLEVENKELEGRTMLSVPDHDPKKKYEFGVIISFAYLVEGSDERIVVATTRIETMLGDTAIAVHPNDKRYAHLLGKFVVHPFNGRKIPIIADDYVDPEFGTGAVKITPAHDFNDYNIGKRHGLEMINVLTDDGKINENGSQFEGLQRFDARVAVLQALKEKGLYVETKDNKMMLPFCARSNNIVEPMMKPQWWVKCQDMANDAMEVVRSGEMQISPPTSEKEWFKWLENSQDWCISRQLWWGHRIPAYHVVVQGKECDSGDEKNWVSGRDDVEALEKARQLHPDVDPSLITIHQDPDVLDTWFSSALWPFVTMGWPDKSKDLDRFYPTSLLETGWDILFFWVARMVMFGIKLTGKAPFKKVFCHAMVRDAHGRKMSKALGNVIDPINVIEGITLEDLHKTLENGNLDPKEFSKAKDGQKQDFPKGIAQCGADGKQKAKTEIRRRTSFINFKLSSSALRFTLLTYPTNGRDINLEVLRIEGYRKFCNKLWNATKFALMKLGNDYIPPTSAALSGKETIADRWILRKMSIAAQESNNGMNDMNFMVSTSAVYQFWLYDLCDIYIELCKNLIENPNTCKTSKDTLYTCLEGGLRLLHPMMPFVTEELYQRLPRRPNDTVPSISLTRYPQFDAKLDADQQVDKEFNLLNGAVLAARSFLANYPVKSVKLHVQPDSNQLTTLFTSHKYFFLTLIKNVNAVDIREIGAASPKSCAAFAISDNIKGFIDFESDITRIGGEVDKLNAEISTLSAQLGSLALKEAKTAENKIAKLQTEFETAEKLIATLKTMSIS